jgi:hypothetical protein
MVEHASLRRDQTKIYGRRCGIEERCLAADLPKLPDGEEALQSAEGTWGKGRAGTYQSVF